MADALHVDDTFPRDRYGHPVAANHHKDETGAWQPWDRGVRAQVWDSNTLQWKPMEQPGGSSVTIGNVGVKDAAETRINPAREDGNLAAIKTGVDVLNSLTPLAYDHITLGYTGEDVTSVVYRSGGSGGSVVGTLTLGYTGGKLTTVARS